MLELNWLRQLYLDVIDAALRVKECEQIAAEAQNHCKKTIADHKRICIDYVEKQRRLMLGDRKMSECRAHAADRGQWLWICALSYVVPNKEDRDILYKRAWRENIRNPNKRCDWCKDKPEGEECVRCLRNVPEPEPISLEEVDKLIYDAQVMCKAYEEKVVANDD